MVCMGATEAFSQRPPREKRGDKPEMTAEKSAQGPEKEKKAKGPETMQKFLKKDTKVIKGFTTVYKQSSGKWYININDSIIGRDIEVVSRVSKSAEGSRIMGGFAGYAGDQIGEGVIRFSKGPDNKIFMQQILMRERSKGDLAQNVMNSNVNAIIGSFDIAAKDSANNDNVIDVTDFICSDNSVLFFGKSDKKAFGLGQFMKDRSYISSIKTFPINTEIKLVATYGKSERDGTATFELNASMVLLPKVPMQARYYDERVGYFVERYTDFDKNPQGIKNISMITRWRLEPKAEDMEKYKRGELVEPVKPIVIYIDPTTPKEWIPYLIQGVNDWQPAFEAAGFKNAIRAEVAPTAEQDSTWSLDDATHSAIVYKPSVVENAMGPHVSDPRSGEIIETHVSWYHNVMKLLRDWYMIQCSPADPQARNLQLPTELMGQLIRFVSSHELGHTLGLRHNFAGSSCQIYTAANLKNVEFLKKYGHATSIMDYCRFLYTAEEADNIPQNLLFPSIGIYDKWAIEWGYKLYPQYKSADEEVPFLSKMVSDKIKDPLYKFGTESDANDPRFQNEDVGANQMETNEIGTRNLKFIMKHIEEWTKTPNEGYENCQEIYDQLVGQFVRYNNHVAKWIGGVYTDDKRSDESGVCRTYVPKSKQKEAFAYLKKNFFVPQMWIVPGTIFGNINRRPDLVMQKIFSSTIGNLTSRRVFLNLYEGELINGSSAYSISEYFTDLNAAVFAPASSSVQVAAYQRSLQKIYVRSLLETYTGENAMRMMVGGRVVTMGSSADKDVSDIGSMIYYQLTELQKKCLTLSTVGTPVQKAHYKFLYDNIHKTLTAQKLKKAE